jgi:hypothetical protein
VNWCLDRMEEGICNHKMEEKNEKVKNSFIYIYMHIYMYI